MVKMVVSEETNYWNKLGLEVARQRSLGIEIDVSIPAPSAEEMRRRQEETYKWNEVCIAYARRIREAQRV